MSSAFTPCVCVTQRVRHAIVPADGRTHKKPPPTVYSSLLSLALEGGLVERVDPIVASNCSVPNKIKEGLVPVYTLVVNKFNSSTKNVETVFFTCLHGTVKRVFYSHNHIHS